MGMSDMKGLMPLLIRSAIDQEVTRQAETLKLIKKGDKGDKGEKGDKGKDGYTPQRGIDYFDGLPGKDGYTPVKGIDYFDGLPGRDADLSPEALAASVKFVLESMPELLSGLKGAPGKDGVSFELAEDVLTFGGEWKAGVTYRKGALVALGGDIWYRDTPGSDGKPGKGFQWKMFLRSGAGRLSGYGVVQGQGGGGITSLTIDSTPITGGTAGAVLFVDATGTKLTDSANLTYTETSGPFLKIGTGSTTSVGLAMGYAQVSGYGGLWNSNKAQTFANAVLAAGNDGTLYLNALSGANLIFTINTTEKARFQSNAGYGLGITAGTATTDVQALSATQTWSNASQAFTGIKFTITDTNSAAGSLAMQILGGASGTTTLLSSGKDGTLVIPAGVDFKGDNSNTGRLRFLANANDTLFGRTSDTNEFGAVGSQGGVTFGFRAASNAHYGWCSAANNVQSTYPDTILSRGGANQVVFAADYTTGGGTAKSRAEINKFVTAFTDGVAKTVFTLTIPNAAHSASYLVRLTGSIGAGGAIGANEASATNAYIVTICRTAGVNAVAGISAAFGASTSAVAGATTVTCTGALAAVSGGVGATNTIDIQATITKGGGASDNHTCVATASLLNANSSGITIS